MAKSNSAAVLSPNSKTKGVKTGSEVKTSGFMATKSLRGSHVFEKATILEIGENPYYALRDAFLETDFKIKRTDQIDALYRRHHFDSDIFEVSQPLNCFKLTLFRKLKA
jgi:hypothetical protein